MKVPDTEIALVTGANRGLGLAVARRLGRAGLLPVLGARDPEHGARAAALLRREGLDVEAVHLDVTDPATVASAAGRIENRHGRLDVLVNNAGVLPESTVGGTRVPLRLDMVRSTFATNVFGTVAVTEAMLPLLRRATTGRIVNVSSALGSLALQTDPAWPSYPQVVPAYQASKTALNALTVALAKLLDGTGVTVNAVCPGFVRTDIHPPENRARAALTPDEAAGTVAAVALERHGPTGRFLDRDGVLPW